MSLDRWLTGGGEKPGCKRKAHGNPQNSPPKKKFSKDMSQNSFNWYSEDEAGKWHCTFCRSAKLDIAYAKGHDTPAKTTNHSRHAASQSHLTAITKSKLAEQKPMKKMIEKKIQEDNDNALGYLWAAYHLAKRELPKEEFSSMIDLIEMGGKDMKRTSALHYTTNESLTEFQSAISESILDNKLKEIENSPVYSIVVDESTGKGNRKRLIIYAQYFCEKEIKMCLLNNIEIWESSANAEVITYKILDELNSKGLNLTNFVGIGTDGASVMTGCNNGVVKRLRETCQSLVGVHCTAHRCALSASQATKGIQEMESYQRTVTNVFRFFSNSALRENKLREIQKLLNQPTLKYADIHSVRWLSMENAVSVLYRTYPALQVTLSHIAACGDIVAKSLLNEITQYKFISLTHWLMDILPFLGRLSKTFQSVDLDFSKVTPIVNSVCESLEDLLICEGVFADKLTQFVQVEDDNASVMYSRPLSESTSRTVQDNKDANIEFEGFSDEESEAEQESSGQDSEFSQAVPLRYYKQQQQSLPKVMEKYVTSVVSNLKDRFEQSELLACMDVILPGSLQRGSYGLQEIRTLASHFSKQLDIDVDSCVSEYKQYKSLVMGSYQRESITEICEIMNLKYQKEIPNMCLLLKCCLVIPMTSAQCERGFSTQNRIKTKLRCRLNSNNLVTLMRISEDGPELKKFDFTPALIKWKTKCTRKLYKK